MTTLIPSRLLAVRLLLVAVVSVTSYSPAVAAVVGATVKVIAAAAATDAPRIVSTPVDTAAPLTLMLVLVPVISMLDMLLKVSPDRR